MTPEQLSTFRDTGCLRMEQALPRKRVAAMKAHVVGELARLGIRASGKTRSPSLRKTPAFQQIAKLSGLLRQDDLGARLADAGLLDAIATLAGTRLVPTDGQYLVSLPRQGDWTLDGLNWHTDLPATGHRRVPGIQLFVLVDDVRPRAGATLALAGTHRLADEPAAWRRLRALLRDGGALEGELQRQGLAIVEMAGRAGDAYLMDMRLLHTPSINASDRPRIMATLRCLPEPAGAA